MFVFILKGLIFDLIKKHSLATTPTAGEGGKTGKDGVRVDDSYQCCFKQVKENRREPEVRKEAPSV